MADRIEKALLPPLADHQRSALEIPRVQRGEIKQAPRRRIRIEEDLKAPVQAVSLRGDLRGDAPSRAGRGLEQEPVDTRPPKAGGAGQARKTGSDDDHHGIARLMRKGCYTLTGLRCQISRAYSSIVRSLENLPILAVLRMAISAHFALSLNAASTRSWASL